MCKCENKNQIKETLGQKWSKRNGLQVEEKEQVKTRRKKKLNEKQ